MKGVFALAAATAATLLAAGAARASFIVDRNVDHISLRVSGATAIVSYTKRGRPRHVLLWGAVDARRPRARVPQVSFRVRYGAGTQGGGSCRPYSGPPLALFVAACDGPDGSHWALQSWQRLLPNYGGKTGPWELHASHWTGPLPKLSVWLDWSYRGRFQHLFGRFTYRGEPVYGFRSTPTGSPRDGYGRNLYLDVYDSTYGSGWRRENSFLSHNPTGTFCYGFYSHGSRPGTGAAYRLTAAGPGVTPVVSWRGRARGRYNRKLDRRLNALERSFGDRLCRQG